MTDPIITGVHHVTALAKSPRSNLDFYSRVLGMRFVKRTVNHDDPMTYHLYYADAVGSPGSVLTHFPHPRATRANHGSGEIRRTTLAVPNGTLGFWRERLVTHEVEVRETTHFGVARLDFEDPDGMELGICEANVAGVGEPWTEGGVDAQHAIRTVDAVTLYVRDAGETGDFLRSALGFASADAQGGTQRLTLLDGAPGRRLDLVEDAGDQKPMGAGTVHHVAWRVADDEALLAVVDRLAEHNVAATPVIDRVYFHSIYFRVPGRVIFEIATEGPGFDADEPMVELGSKLVLPPQHEPRRAEIEAHLLPLDGEN
ncbi:MAG: VOC family protein [Phycisphaerales bacterium]|jgi:glyoxalase family protein